jgi:hypothetical protein
VYRSAVADQLVFRKKWFRDSVFLAFSHEFTGGRSEPDTGVHTGGELVRRSVVYFLFGLLC